MTMKNLEGLIGILVLSGIAAMTQPAWKSAEVTGEEPYRLVLENLTAPPIRDAATSAGAPSISAVI
jgi:hypothetical protein